MGDGLTDRGPFMANLLTTIDLHAGWRSRGGGGDGGGGGEGLHTASQTTVTLSIYFLSLLLLRLLLLWNHLLVCTYREL